MSREEFELQKYEEDLLELKKRNYYVWSLLKSDMLTNMKNRKDRYNYSNRSYTEVYKIHNKYVAENIKYMVGNVAVAER